MSGITLSAATRQSLISAQDTAALMQTTQGRLSTGKKVSSALDNPTEFFTAAGLDSRSSDLSALLDGISNGIQTIQAASTGITNIQKLVDSAKSTANQALSTTVTTTGAATTKFGVLTGASNAAAATVTSTATTLDSTHTLTATGLSAGQSLTINGTTINIQASGTEDATHVNVGSNLSVLMTKLDAASGATSTITAGGALKIDQNDTTSDITIGGTAGALTTLGLSAGTTHATAAVAGTYQSASNANVTFKVDGNTVTGTIPSGKTAQETAGILNGLSGVSAGTFGVDSTGHITVDSTSDVEITDGTTKTALGFSGATGAQASELSVVGADTRANLATQYNDLLDQIDQLASDASYNGVNLLNSSDTSNKLHLAFNEKDTSNLDVQGVDAGASGLGLTKIDVTSGGPGNFSTDTAVKSTISSLTNATTKLRSYSSTFGSNLTVVQNRQDFTKNLTNVLTTGSSNLVNADLNEEAANSQALSTRQSLAISALSLANTAQQGVLQLLR